MLGVASGLLAARGAAASPEDLFGYGARTSAMGATGTAHATGYEAAWHNPALASVVRTPKLTLGYTGGVLLDLGAHLQGDIVGLTTALYDLETHSVNNFLPQQLVFGGSWKLAKNVTGTFDATWVNWAAYVPPVAQLDVALDIPPP